MPSIEEMVAGGGSPMEATLKAGLTVLSEDQHVTFTRYLKLILPMDGFVFWVRADLVSPSGGFNTSQFDTATFNQNPTVSALAQTVDVAGSLHYSTKQTQAEDGTYGVNQVIFTADEEIQEFNSIAPGEIYIGQYKGLRFAFSSRGRLYKVADLFHYVGDAIYPAMETQIIDDVAAFDSAGRIVSDSLPIWLSLNRVVPMYPSFLVPENIKPPYASVHIIPESARALQGVPYLDKNSNHSQLVAEKVRVTLYGLRNLGAMDFVDYILAYMANGDTLGLMNTPVVRDEKRVQSELSIIAQKKTVEFEVSYYQTAARDIARRLILSCVPTLYV